MKFIAVLGQAQRTLPYLLRQRFVRSFVLLSSSRATGTRCVGDTRCKRGLERANPELLKESADGYACA